MGALVETSHLAEIRRFATENGIKVAFAYGSYDLLHKGHMRNFRLIRSLVGSNCLVIIGIRNDCMTKVLKGAKRPYLPESIRAMSVATVPQVDFAVISAAVQAAGMIGLDIIKELKPDIMFIPPDACLLEMRMIVAERLGIIMAPLDRDPPEEEDISSTKILEEIGHIAPSAKKRRASAYLEKYPKKNFSLVFF